MATAGPSEASSVNAHDARQVVQHFGQIPAELLLNRHRDDHEVEVGHADPRLHVLEGAFQIEAAHHPFNGPHGENAGYRVTVVPLREQLFGGFRTGVLLLAGEAPEGVIAARDDVHALSFTRSLVVMHVAGEDERRIALGVDAERRERRDAIGPQLSWFSGFSIQA